MLNCDHLYKTLSIKIKKGWASQVLRPWCRRIRLLETAAGLRNSVCHLVIVIFCGAAILSPTERAPRASHCASSSDCRRESVLKGPGPPFLRCQVTPPVALVVIVSTRNHAMINAYLRERTGERVGDPHRIDPFWWTHRAGYIKGLESVPPPRSRPVTATRWSNHHRAGPCRAWLPAEIVFHEVEIIAENQGTFDWRGPFWRNRSIYSSILSRYR